MTPDRHEPSTAELTLIPEAAMRSLLAGSLREAREITGLELPDDLLLPESLWQHWLNMIRANPAAAPWLVRAVYGRRC